MLPPLSTETQLLRGVVLTLLGVAFWIAPVVFAHYFWKRYRGDGEE